MKLIGFNLTRILIERKEKIQGQLKVDQNIDISDVKTEKIPITDNEALRIYFKFFINYSEDSAKLKFEGSVLGLSDKEEHKKFIEEWKKKKIPEDVRTGLFNFIMNKCNIKALNLEDDMGLPYHIPMPRLNIQPQEKDK